LAQTFQLRLFFHQAQRFGANIFNSAYFFFKRKGLAQTFSEKHQKFSIKDSFKPARTSLQFVSLPKEKICKKSNVISVQK
jgi:hypothetical protein